MKYVGSKARHAKEILPIILRNRNEGQFYVEPFVGSGNLIAEVTGNRIGTDINPYLIALHRAIQDGWEPPSEISVEKYNQIKSNKESYPAALVGFVGFACSFASKWFGGYARGKNSSGGNRNYALEGRNNCLSYKPKLEGVKFDCGAYWEFSVPENAIVYCDPPYAGTVKYKDDFEHIPFWAWCDGLILKGHRVFVSEYNAPEGWNCVWQKNVVSGLDKNTGGKRAVEKLFTKST